MGRLFWKFFLSILLAQLVTTIGVGTVFWLRDRSRMQSMASLAAGAAIDTSRAAEFLLDAAEATLVHGGKAALQDLVAKSTHYSLYVIEDDGGREMLGRVVTPQLRSQAAALLAQGTRGKVVRMLTAPDGTRHMAFLRWLGGHGPGGPRMQPGAPGPGQGMGGMSGMGRHTRPGGPPHERPLLPTMTLIGGTAASFLFAGLLAWYFSRPIRALRGAFEAAAAGDLAPRFQPAGRAGGDELTDLGRDFDRMSGQLRTLMDGQRRLLHDVSHELRSPLARLQAAIGLAHQQPEKIAASLARIERESVRMDLLVGELLTLSRLEAAPRLPVQEDIALMELVDEIAVDARFEAEQTGRYIDVIGLTGPAWVRGAPDLLWRAIENVVRNAIKHSPPGGSVTVEVVAYARQASLSVLDRGPGVPAADLQAIFAPFFRSEPASNNIDGHGLGLAIAQRVVAAHGGTIGAANRDGGGLVVTLILPLAPGDA